MNTKDIKKSIKRHLKRGTFISVVVTREQLFATYKALNDNNQFTYIEKHDNGMLVLDTVKNRLTVYRVTNYKF